MEKTLIKELKYEVYKITYEKDGKKINFIAYEMTLPNGTKVNMTDGKNTKLALAQKIIFENQCKQ